MVGRRVVDRERKKDDQLIEGDNDY